MHARPCSLRVKQLAALGVSLAAVLCGGEVLLRLAGYVPIYQVYSRPELFWRHDERLGWSLEPGARGRFVGPRPFPVEFESTIEINSLGLRGPEVGPKQPGEIRILFLGDSGVAGFEVEQSQTFTALLEESFRAAPGAPPLRVVNAGVRGYGTDQSYLWFRERGRQLEADLVVEVFSRNDFEENGTLHRPRRPFGKPAFALRPDGALELVGVPVPHFELCSAWVLDDVYRSVRVDGPAARALCSLQVWLTDRSALFTLVATSLGRLSGVRDLLGSLWRAGDAAREAGGHGVLHASFWPFGGGAPARDRMQNELTSALLRALAREVRASGARFLLIILPADWRRLDAVALRAAGIEPRHPPQDRPIPEARFRNDPHLNATGHRLFAAGLIPIVAEPLREIQRERSTQAR